MSPLQAWRNSTHVHVHECVCYSLGLSRNVIVYPCTYMHMHTYKYIPSLVHHLHHYGVCVLVLANISFFCCAVWAHSSARDERKRECERVSVCERKLPGTRVGRGWRDDYSKIMSRCSYSYSSCLLFLCHRKNQSVSGTPEWHSHTLHSRQNHDESVRLCRV